MRAELRLILLGPLLVLGTVLAFLWPTLDRWWANATNECAGIAEHLDVVFGSAQELELGDGVGDDCTVEAQRGERVWNA